MKNSVWLTLFLFFLAMSSAAAAGKPLDERAGIVPTGDLLPKVTARSAVLMEASTGKIIYQRNMDARRFPASTTKMMTLIIALEHGNLDDMVTVSDKAAHTEGSTLWLEPGDKVRLGDLLCGMMLVSGNDATVAVAEHIAGSVDAFAEMMTAKAHAIGAVDTSFVNSSGLPDERHYTTAHDLALIAAYGYSNPFFVDIVSTKEMGIPWKMKHLPNATEDEKLRNENLLLFIYRGANGVKTGYTDAAGRCLVSAAKRNGVQLVAVVLDSVYMWNDSIAMLDYGFSQVDTQEVVEAGERMRSVAVQGGKQKRVSTVTREAVVIPVFDGEKKSVKTEVQVPDHIKADVHAGDVVGRVAAIYAGHEIAATDLLADEDVERRSFFLTAYHAVQDMYRFVMG